MISRRSLSPKDLDTLREMMCGDIESFRNASMEFLDDLGFSSETLLDWHREYMLIQRKSQRTNRDRQLRAKACEIARRKSSKLIQLTEPLVGVLMKALTEQARYDKWREEAYPGNAHTDFEWRLVLRLMSSYAELSGVILGTYFGPGYARVLKAARARHLRDARRARLAAARGVREIKARSITDQIQLVEDKLARDRPGERVPARVLAKLTGVPTRTVQRHRKQRREQAPD
jgi:hypothetical protein